MSSFTQVKSLRPGRSVFDLSYEKKFDFNIGQIIPVCCEEMVPGDTFKIGNELVINAQPLNAPVYHSINVFVHYFFVPTRLIFDGWEDFITGGIDGNDATVLPRFYQMKLPGGGTPSPAQSAGPYTLWDYFGFPVISDGSGSYTFPGTGVGPSDPAYFYRPLSFPWRCYNLVWNEYYRDETLQSEVNIHNVSVLNRNWSKDYFTSALPFQQRGTSPALPISGNLDVIFTSKGSTLIDLTSRNVNASEEISLGRIFSIDDLNDDADARINEVGPRSIGAAGRVGALQLTGNHVDSVTSGKVDLSDALTFDVSDLRLAFQLQKFMERAARGGVRYTEFLTSFFGVSPTDARLQRPEYLGGSKSPILINQVTQTSESGTTPQGTLRGKGITADKNYICSYTASEFGYLIGLMSVLPMPSYQQGVPRKWLRKSKTDFYFPMFAHLSEEPIYEEQIFAFGGDGDNGLSGDARIWNGKVFGYQAPYNDMRQNQNMVCGSLRDSLSYWHAGRIFDTAPSLNSDFIECNQSRDHLNRIFAVQNVPGLICNFANIITAIRPLPKYGEPGLIDHS